MKLFQSGLMQRPPYLSLSQHLPSECSLTSLLITHHCEGHELQDAPTAPLLQALHALLNEALHKLSLRARHLGPHDGRDEEEQVGWGEHGAIIELVSTESLA